MSLSKAQRRALNAIGACDEVNIKHYAHGPFAPNTIRSLEKLGLIRVTCGRTWGRDYIPEEKASLTRKGLDEMGAL